MENEFQVNADSLIGGETTVLLKKWSGGDEEVFEQLKKHVDGELRRLASYYLSGAKSGHILQPTVIVHDAYLRLLQLDKDAGERKMIPWQNRSHFIGESAKMMRQILIDYIRKENADKRSGGEQVTLGEDIVSTNPAFDKILAVHEALDNLKGADDEDLVKLVKVVELYYFGGFTFKEIAEILGSSETKVGRIYKKAKAILWEILKDSDS